MENLVLSSVCNVVMEWLLAFFHLFINLSDLFQEMHSLEKFEELLVKFKFGVSKILV